MPGRSVVAVLRAVVLEDRSVPSSPGDAPVIPVIDGEMQAHLEQVAALGRSLGNRADAFAKVGDSNTAYPEFVTALGAAGYDPNTSGLAATRADLVGTWAVYRTPVDPSGANSFSRASIGDHVGWTSVDLRDNAVAEYAAIHPAVAVIMIGTNDVGNFNNIPLFHDGLTLLVQQALARGVIPVLSTIPDLLANGGIWADRVPAYNQTVLDVAAALDVPVWNFWRQLEPLPDHGLRGDGTHLSISPNGSGQFGPGDLQYGANVRNLTTLDVLKHVRDVVFGGALPDGYTAPAATAWPGLRPGQQVIAVGADAGRGPEVRVYDAATDQFLAAVVPYEPTFLGGVRVAVGDVDGDGIPDLVTAPGPGGGALIKVFSGADGHLVRSWFAEEPTFRGGASVAAGDVTGDGFADVAVGAGDGGGPRVTVYSGKDGAVLADYFAYEPTFRGGVRVAVGRSAGGGAILVTGAGAGGGAAVRVFDPLTGTVEASYFAGDPTVRGGVYVAAGDVTGDGFADIVAGSGAGGGPRVDVFDGRTGADVTSTFAFDPASRSGVRVAVLPAASGPGAVVAGEGPPSAGQVRVLRGAGAEPVGDPLTPFDNGFRGGVFVAAG